jgi:hypothetical protein
MELLSRAIIDRVFEERESPRDFIKRVSKGHGTLLWSQDVVDDLEDWQLQAAKEIQVHLETPVRYVHHETDALTVGTPDGAQEWIIYENEDSAEAEAIAMVENDLEHEPDLFNQEWLRHHINTEKLTSTLWPDQREHLEDYRDGEDDWKDFLVDKGYLDEDDLYTEDEDGDKVEADNYSELVEAAKDSWIDAQEESFDGMSYLEDIFGAEDAAKQAIEMVGIDSEKAAKEAVATDGFAHFLNRYDGNYDTLPSGAIAMRIS